MFLCAKQVGCQRTEGFARGGGWVLAPTRGTDGAGGRHFWLWFLPWCPARWSWQQSTSLPTTATGTGGTRSRWGCPRGASWLQNPSLEPYGKTELCQTVWPILFVFLFLFFLFFPLPVFLLQVGGGFLLGSSPTSVLQGKGMWSCAAAAAWIPSSAHEGFFRCDSSYPCQHNPAAQPAEPGMLASFSNPGWATFVPLTQSAAIYAYI